MDDLNKLSAGIDGRVSRHINSTIEQQDSLCKEMNTELNVAKHEISTFMQKASKKTQQLRDSFCRSELDNARKFSELDREEARLEQISKVVNNTILQHNNCTLYDAS